MSKKITIYGENGLQLVLDENAARHLDAIVAKVLVLVGGSVFSAPFDVALETGWLAYREEPKAYHLTPQQLVWLSDHESDIELFVKFATKKHVTL